MKKLILTALLALSITLPGFSADFSVNLDINYNHGSSGFFDKSQMPLSNGGMNFIEERQNLMGLGFHAGINISILERLYVVPGFSIYFGHQQYDYSQVDTGSTGENDAKETYYFKIYSGELSLRYDVLVLKNGWHLSLLGGLNYNHFTADDEMLMENEKYWGMQTGIAARFFQLRHLGFQAAFIYKKPFGKEFASFISGQAGIIYRF